MASTPLQLFPPPLSHTPPSSNAVPRKSSLKKSRPAEVDTASGELKGVAWQVTSGPVSPKVQPANDHMRHTSISAPSSSTTETFSRASPKRHVRTRRSSSASNASHAGPSTKQDTSSVEEDQLSPLPINAHFGSISPRRVKSPASQLQRPNVPRNISTEAQASESVDQLVTDSDKLSPLPEKTRFKTASPVPPGYQSPQSVRSRSPPLYRSNSSGSMKKPPLSPNYSMPMKSIFPQYDHSKPLRQQQYYARASSLPTALPRAQVSKLESPVEKHVLKRMDSGVAMTDSLESLPAADDGDLIALWNASCGQFPVAGRKVQLSLHQPSGSGTSLAIGISGGKLFYLMETMAVEPPPGGTRSAKQLCVKRQCPQEDMSMPVAQLELLSTTADSSSNHALMTTVFPHLAALNAIEFAANTPTALAIARFDPTAASPEAAQLAHDAVAEAHVRYRSDLVRTTRGRDSVGAVAASYQLCHPALGIFALTVNRAKSRGPYLDPKAKISLHHPSATPAAVAAETLVLAALDFARDACILDLPALLALEDPYIIDTSICALLAVAVIENDMIKAETLTFDPPPTTPVSTKRKARSNSPTSLASSTSSRSSRSSRKWYKPFSKRNKVLEIQEPLPVEEPLPALTQGALALLGFSLKTAVWLLGAGVKVAGNIVVGASHLASKA